MYLFLFASFLAGVTIRFLLSWAFSPSFSLSSELRQIIAVVVVGAGVAWLTNSMQMTGWFAYAFLAACGFMSKYGMEWLAKKKG